MNKVDKVEEFRDIIIGDYSPISYKEYMIDNETLLLRALRSDEIIRDFPEQALDWMRHDLALADNTLIYAVFTALRKYLGAG